MSEPQPGGTGLTIAVTGAVDRVDRVLGRHFPGASRQRLGELFDDGLVRVDGRRARKGDRVGPGAIITLARAPGSREDLRALPDPAAAERLIVLYVDDELVAVAKPAGMPSQPLRVGELGTAASGLIARFPECATVADDPRDGGLVHRLDIGTSGVLLAARTRDGWRRLRAAFTAGQVDKQYQALVATPPIGRGCDEPLAQRGRKVAVDYTDGLEASTSWEIERVLGEHRLLRCRARTGRMHQIRAHLALCGAPIVGDALYGGPPCPGLIEFFLHAAVVEVATVAGRTTISAPLPADRQATLHALTP